MIQEISFDIPQLHSMRKYPPHLFYKGNLELLQKRKISIVGSRKLNPYAKELTCKLASKLSNAGVCVVSGGAIGADTIAHLHAGTHNTIMVAGTGLDKRYPAINARMIQSIEENGLVLSQFAIGTPSAKYNFPLRNELIVALGEVIVVAYADIGSGSMRSVEYALKMQKEIFVFPHRLGESQATNDLLSQGFAKCIYDIDAFVALHSDAIITQSAADPFLVFCDLQPSLFEALGTFGELVYEYELQGLIKIINGKIVRLS
ncbi:MAG: DNA-protecting protein DprA [Sulfurospirillum sp.]|nr:DNA-protecting protein DprA [Sulfurospirillum sp.]